MVKPTLLPPNGVRRFYTGGPRSPRCAATRRRAIRTPRPRARGLGRLDDRGVRRARRRAQRAAGRQACCAMLSRPIPRPGWAPRTSRAGAPIPRCWSSCSTRASACRCTCIPTARSPGSTSARGSARPRRGSSSAASGVVHLGWRRGRRPRPDPGLGRRAGRRRDVGRLAPAGAGRRRRGLRPGRRPARDRRRAADRRAAGAERHVRHARVGRPRHRRRRPRRPSASAGRRALSCVETRARDAAALRRPARGGDAATGRALPGRRRVLRRRPGWPRARAPSPVPARASRVLLVLEGAGRLESADGAALSVARGDNVVIPVLPGGGSRG